MARPIEYGLKYFPMDVGFLDDPKLVIIEDRFKAKGIVITTRLMCLIYNNGYFLPWTNDMPFVVAKRVGCEVTGALVTEVVKALIQCGFFDEAVFNSCQIITSNGIQKRWQQVMIDCKRKAVIEPNHKVNSELTAVSSEETFINSESIPQRKGKEIKVNENKEEIVHAAHDQKNDDLKIRKDHFVKSLEQFVEKYGRDMLNDFYRHWSQINPGGKKMLFEMQRAFEVSKRLVTWKNNEIKFNKNGVRNNVAGVSLASSAKIEVGKSWGKLKG